MYPQNVIQSRSNIRISLNGGIPKEGQMKRKKYKIIPFGCNNIKQTYTVRTTLRLVNSVLCLHKISKNHSIAGI